jgi:DNA helicase-2/ATP-dependent DNA helicase PcrA
MEQKIFKPSSEQQRFLDWIKHCDGSAVLEAVAGAGKTTTLVEGVKLMKGSIFLGAYNKKMAEELKLRIKDIPNAKAGTFHSAGYTALRRANDKLKDPNDKKVRELAELHAGGNPLFLDKDFLSAVCKLVSLAKQTGFYVSTLVPEAPVRYWKALVDRHDVADGLPEDADVGVLCTFADRVLKMSNDYKDVIDFDDMVYLPLLRNLRMWQNDWVLVDEAQDTNAVRRELARRMLKPSGRLVAVGDPHQAIYGFTGADNDSLQLIKDRFQAATLKLSVSWRCPQAVVTVAREYVKHINAAPTAAAGEVLRSAYKGMLESVSPGDAVLSRFNAPLVELCFRLIRAGKAAKIEGRSIGEGLVALVGRWKVTTLNALEGKLEKWRDREIAKIEAAPKLDENKRDVIRDKFDTLMVLLERAREQNISTVADLKKMILDMFDDVGTAKNLVVLSSVHRSKGLEWQKVYLLGRGDVMPPKREMQEWQMEQEINLCYVAVTRAQAILVDVAMPVPGELDKKTDEKKEAA